MSWYEALVPAAMTAILVRLDALFLGPYWSWLQLVPDLGEGTEPEIAIKRRRALARRVAIPGVVGLILQSLWPMTYTPRGTAGVGLIAAGLLLWPLIFARSWNEVRKPIWMVYFLYALLPVLFAASGYLGGLIASWISEDGGLMTFLRDEGVAILVTAVVLLFATDGTSRLAESLRRRRDAMAEEESSAS